jgi:hypothetical protein
MSISEPFWKRNVKVVFKTCENDYKYKVIASWEQLFWQYSKDDFKINIAEKKLIQAVGDKEKIETIVDYCQRIFKSKNTSHSRNKMFGLLSPFQDYLSHAKSNAEAQFFLGYCYLGYERGIFSIAKALKYFQLSANQENAMALLYLGLRFKVGIEVDDNHILYFETFKPDFDTFKRAADLGNARAQNIVSLCYLKGEGTAQDYENALKYTTMSAEQGDALGLFTLGKLYFKGVGIAQDIEKSFIYFKRAADLGSAPAQGFIAIMYRKGIVTKIDHAKAFQYTKLCADQGNKHALANLAQFYFEGIGTKVDHAKAFKYTKKVAKVGFAKAQCSVGMMYMNGEGTAINQAKAFKYTKLSAGQGNAAGQACLGYFYLAGVGTKVNHAESFKYTQMAANQDHDVGLFNLGYCYREGIGTDKNLKKALEYTQKSLDQGNIPAQNALNEIKALLEQEALNGS